MSRKKLLPLLNKCNKDEANYLSIGCLETNNHGPIVPNKCSYSGKFKFNPDELFEFIMTTHDKPEGKLFCFVERRSEYFMLIYDFDIDKYLPNKETIDIDTFIKYLIDNVERALIYYIITNSDNDEIKYIYSDRIDKSNFHLYFPNIILNTYQALIIRQKIIEQLMSDNKFNLTIETYNDIIDSSIYDKSGLKPLFQRKPHEEEYYKINKEKSTYAKIPDNKIGQLQVTAIRKTDKNINVNLKCDESGCPILTNDVEKHNILMSINDKQKCNKPIIITKKGNIKPARANTNPFKLDIPEAMVEELFNNLNATRYNTYKSWLKIMFICLNYGLKTLAHCVSLKCPEKYNQITIDELFHKRVNSQDHANPITIGSLYEWSKVDDPEHHKIILDKYYTQGYYKEVSYDINRNFESESLPYCETYNSKFLKPLDINTHKSFIIKASLGTNKSGECIKAITDIVEREQINRINCIASRILLVSDLFSRFNEPIYNETENRPKHLKMETYSLIKKNLYEHKRLIQTPDSLYLMADIDGIIEAPDIVFIDEIESLLEYVCTSDTLKQKRIMVFEALCNYIRKAKYIFLVDGNLSKQIIDFLHEIRNDDNLKFIYNKQKTDDNKYYFIKNECDWMEKLDSYLKQGKIIYIPTDNKNMSDVIHKYIQKKYPHYKTQLYNVDTDDEHKINIGNVNENWRQYGVIIVSPTILYGINFSDEYFDVILGYYQTTILPGSVYQQLRRIRYVKSKEVFIYLRYSSATQYYPTNKTELRNYVQKNLKDYSDVSGSLKIICDDGFKLDIDHDFTKLYLYFLEQRHMANNNYLMELIIRINEWGGTCFVEMKKMGINTKLNEIKKELIDELQIDKIRALLKANDELWESDNPKQLCENSKYKICKTSHDKNIMIIGYIYNTFNLKTINELFLKDLNKLTNINQFNKSIIYFANDNYKAKVINKGKYSDYDLLVIDIFKQTEFIKECIKLFWPDGLFSREQIDVFTGLESLTNEQKLFISTNESNLRILFHSLKRKAKVIYSYQLFGWLDAMIMEFFGGFITFNISDQKTKPLNGKRTVCYSVTISLIKYIELLSNKNKYILKNIPPHILETECIYKSLHNVNKIADFYLHIANEEDYDFINEEIIPAKKLDYV